jgi:hypothetical protein
MALSTVLQARAHVGDVLDTVEVTEDPDVTGRLHIDASFGLITLEDGEARWVCHETITAPEALVSPRFVQSASGRWAAWTDFNDEAREGHPVWVSDDRCDWTPTTGLDDTLVQQVAWRGDELWVATALQGAQNALFRATDDVFTSVTPPTDDAFVSLYVDDDAIWALSTDRIALTLWHSADGETFTTQLLDVDPALPRPLDGRIALVDPADPERVWIVLDPVGPDQLVESTDRGASWTVLWEPEGNIGDVEQSPDGTLFAVLDERAVHSDAAGAFEEVPDLGFASSLAFTSDGLWLGGRTFADGTLVARSVDGATLDTVVPPDDIAGPLECPATSTVATFCDPLWPLLAPRLDTTEVPTVLPPLPTVPPPPPGACGCTTAEPSPWSFSIRRRR